MSLCKWGSEPMIRLIAVAAAITLTSSVMASSALAQDADPGLETSLDRPSTEYPGELEVEPYERSNANAGAVPFAGLGMYDAFHGPEGVARVANGFVDRVLADPRLIPAFAAADEVRFRRTIREQFCYILGGPCQYTGRDMLSSHRDVGGQATDFAAIVENLQAAMSQEGIPFATQNRFLAKLAPMRRDTVVR